MSRYEPDYEGMRDDRDDTRFQRETRRYDSEFGVTAAYLRPQKCVCGRAYTPGHHCQHVTGSRPPGQETP